MYNICIMERESGKTGATQNRQTQIEKPTQSYDYGKRQCQICGSSVYIWNLARRTGTKKHKGANYILSEGSDMK